MAAKRYMLRLYEGMSRRGLEVETNFDRKDKDQLRELLEELVKAVAGDLNRDLSKWSLHVLSTGGGTLHCRVSVDRAGRTVVR